MKRLFILTIFLTGLLFTAGNASACAECYQQESKKNECKIVKLKSIGKLLWSNKDYLGLTKEQLDKLKEIKNTALKDLIRLNAEVEVVEIDLKSEMWEPLIAVETVNGLIDQKFAAKTKIAKTFVKAVADMQQILSEEQRAKALKLAMKAEMGAGECDMKLGCDQSPKTTGGPRICPITGKPLIADKPPLKASGAKVQ